MLHIIRYNKNKQNEITEKYFKILKSNVFHWTKQKNKIPNT